MKKTVIGCVIFICIVIAGCIGNTTDYPEYSGQEPPYILKEECTFKIVTDQGSASVSSPVVSGGPGVSGSSSVSIGEYTIEVADCDVISNPSDLSIYE
jgi:hypothetical protein